MWRFRRAGTGDAPRLAATWGFSTVSAARQAHSAALGEQRRPVRELTEMRPRPVRIVAGGSRREGTVAVPRVGRRVRMFVLAAAAGLAVLAGAMTSTTA